MEYLVSEKEIKRRINAFTSLAISLPASFGLASLLLWRENLKFAGIFFICLIVVFALFWIYIVKFFHYFLKTKINLAGEYLERITPKLKQNISLDEVCSITIVETTAKKIREIRIFTGKETLVLDGLENFSQFADELIKKCQKDLPVVIKREPIDYDHPVFYPVLGCIVGSASLFFVKVIASLNFDGSVMKILTYLILSYVVAIGLYFIFGKPLTRRYGSKSYLADFIWGLLLLMCAMAIILFF